MEMFAADQKISASLATPLDPIDDLLAGKREIQLCQAIGVRGDVVVGGMARGDVLFDWGWWWWWRSWCSVFFAVYVALGVSVAVFAMLLPLLWWWCVCFSFLGTTCFISFSLLMLLFYTV